MPPGISQSRPACQRAGFVVFFILFEGICGPSGAVRSPMPGFGGGVYGRIAADFSGSRCCGSCPGRAWIPAGLVPAPRPAGWSWLGKAGGLSVRPPGPPRPRRAGELPGSLPLGGGGRIRRRTGCPSDPGWTPGGDPRRGFGADVRRSRSGGGKKPRRSLPLSGWQAQRNTSLFWRRCSPCLPDGRRWWWS